jgi:hypothetical protein
MSLRGATFMRRASRGLVCAVTGAPDTGYTALGGFPGRLRRGFGCARLPPHTGRRLSGNLHTSYVVSIDVIALHYTRRVSATQ